MPATSAPHPSPPAAARATAGAGAGAGENSPGWLDLPRGWLFEHLHEAVLVVELGTGRVELANPAARRLFGHPAVGAAIGQLVPGLLQSRAWQRLVQHAQAEERAEHADLEVSLSRLDRRFGLAVVRRVSDRAAAALATQHFLDQATRELTSSLDYETTLHAAARVGVPRLGDACVVDVLGDDAHVIERVAAAHVDDQDEARLLDLADSYPRQPHEPRHGGKPAFDAGPGAGPRLKPKPAFDVARDARPRRFDDIPPEAGAWTRIAADQAHAEVLAGLGLRSAMRLPLVVRGHLLGTMLLAARVSRRFSDADFRLAQDLARRCALAIDNARLYCVARQAITARDQFVAIASHELRAPLTRLKSHAEVLLLAQAEGELDPERLVWSLRRINAAADRLAALARDLLDVSRLQGGQLPFRPGPVNLGRLLSDLVPRFADQLDAAHPLVLDLPPRPLRVLVDQDRLEQVLSNLLDNAVRYSPDGGEIRVRLEPSQAGVLLSVRDHGVGLPPGQAELIFEPFGRASNAAGRNVPGLGLGLHICRVIVERHAGRIWATSDGEGGGTTVWVWLPLASRASLPQTDIRDHLANQLTLAVGYCELLASNPSLAPELRAQASAALHGAQEVAAVLGSLAGALPVSLSSLSRPRA